MNKLKQKQTKTIQMSYPAPYSQSWVNDPEKKMRETSPKKKKNTVNRVQMASYNRSWPTNPRPEKPVKRAFKQPSKKLAAPVSQSWVQQRPRPKPTQIRSPTRIPAAKGLKQSRGFKESKVSKPQQKSPKGLDRFVRINVEEGKRKNSKLSAGSALTHRAPAPSLAVSNTVHLDIKPRTGRYLLY